MSSALSRPAIYPFEEWRVSESEFDYDNNFRDETIFAVGNGLIGVRGGFEEGYAGPIGSTADATFINGFYESGVVNHAEPSYGLASVRQSLLNVTNGKIIRLMVDGESFQMTPENTTSFYRFLDFKRGIQRRSLVWQTKSGKQLKVEVERLASFTRKRLLAISYTVTPLNFSGQITIMSGLDGEVYNRRSANDPRVGSFFSGQALVVEEKIVREKFFALKQRTKVSKFALVCGMTNRITSDDAYTTDVTEGEQTISVSYTIDAKKDSPVKLEKYVSYFHSKHELEDVLPTLSETEVMQAAEAGFDQVRDEQTKYMTDYWRNAVVEIEGDIPLVQGLRFNLFQLLQSVGRDGRTSIAAKGVVGEGYEGHFFWDSEIFVLPIFLHTDPELAKSLLEYRYSILDASRARARELSVNGAMYAWRTIDGEELSAYYPAGTAQYHINADIAYAFKQYYLATGDKEFTFTKGAEVVFETARAWLSLGDYITGKGFCINCVTGPDEYTALINNNTYTNIMAKDHLEFAVELASEMKRVAPKEYRAITQKIAIDELEFAEWARAAKEMYIHYDRSRGLIGQDDSFLDKARWDFKSLPQEKRPFNMNFHYLHIYRYQVLKQADLVQALFLQSDRFSRVDKVRSYDYYEPITSHDSSLSMCVHSIIAGEIGYRDQAYQYYVSTVRVDLDDIHYNVRDGIHAAAISGSWLGLVYGFGGAREGTKGLSFAPWLPEGWKGFAFSFVYRGATIKVTISPTQVMYELLSGTKATFEHRGQKVEVKAGTVKKFPLIPDVEAVLFDLDGVITDTAEMHYEGWGRLAKEIDVRFDREYNEQLKGIGRMESLDILLKRSKRHYSMEEKLEMAERKNNYYVELLSKIGPDDVLPGIKEVLQDLRARNVKIGLCSASKNARMVVDRLGVADLFDTIVDAATLTRGKPDPEIFIRGAEQLGVVPEACVGVEDAASGIIAVRKAGMFALGIGQRETLAEASYVIAKTEELTADLILSRAATRAK